MEKLTLTQIARILKSEWVLIILAVFSIGVFSVAVYSFSKGKTSKPAKSPQAIAWQNKVFAGKTTKEEVDSTLGPPIKIEEKATETSYFYPSTNQYRPHEVKFMADTVSIVKEQVIGNEKGKLSNYLQKYGPPDTEVFGKHGTFAPGHFWGSIGLLIFANKNDGTIIEIWYFKPTTLEQFLTDHPELKRQPTQNF